MGCRSRPCQRAAACRQHWCRRSEALHGGYGGGGGRCSGLVQGLGVGPGALHRQEVKPSLLWRGQRLLQEARGAVESVSLGKAPLQLLC